MPGFKVPDVPPPTVVPHMQSKQQRAAAVQKLLGLASAPTLGETVSLTPGAPSVPGKAELMFNSPRAVHGGNLWMTSMPTSGAAFLDDGSNVFLTIAAGAGMRYVLDCRIDPAAKSIAHEDLITGIGLGEVSVGSDGHFLIAMEKTTSVKQWIIAMAPRGKGSYYFYGCEVSPF